MNLDLLSPPPTPHPPLHPDITLELSPSKALAHHQQQTAWNQVSSWLSSLYHPSSPPAIERNDATMHYLQSLMHANLRADQRRRVLHGAQVEQVGVYHESQRDVEGSPEIVLLDELKGALSSDARAKLSSVAKVSVLLGVIPTSQTQTPSARTDMQILGSVDDEDTTTLLAKRIMDLTQSLFSLQNHLDELLVLRQDFEDERTTLEQETALLREDLTPSEAPALGNDTFPPHHQTSRTRLSLDALHTQTTNLTTSQKHLHLKITEYQTRITALTRTLQFQSQSESQTQHRSQSQTQTHCSSELTIETLQAKESLLRQRHLEIKTLETQLKQFNGLPPEIEASREELRRAQGELEEWRRRREKVFGEMSGG